MRARAEQPEPDVPASFLPSPKRQKRSFTDEPLFDAPPPSDPRAAALVDEALRENPDAGRPVPWDGKKRGGRR